MPLYYYESFTRSGKKVTGTIDAPSPQGAKDTLQGQGLMPTKIESAASRSRGFSLGGLFRKKVDQKTLIIFTKQLAVLLRSGVPLVEALELLIEQFEDPFAPMLMTITEGVKGGSSLADQLEQYPEAFSNVYVQLVRAGEASGKLETILERQVAYMQRSMETAQQVSSALRQPIFLMCFIVLVLAGVLGFIVPRMSDIFMKTGRELPGITNFMVGASDFITGNYIFIITGLMLLVFGFTRWKHTESGGYTVDSWKLKIPLVSYFSRTKAVVQFCQTLGMLMESGVNLSEALDIVVNIVENKVLVQKLRAARDNIIKEGKIARYLKETGLFPKMASYMIATGEESGKLAEMLTTVGKDYDAELIGITESLTAAIDPIMKIVIGGIVFVIVLAIFLPIMQMGDLAGI